MEENEEVASSNCNHTLLACKQDSFGLHYTKALQTTLTNLDAAVGRPSLKPHAGRFESEPHWVRASTEKFNAQLLDENVAARRRRGFFTLPTGVFAIVQGFLRLFELPRN